LPRQLEPMNVREKRIGELVERVRQETSDFRKPAMIIIGGYALRVFVPFARYSRDCDFALPHGQSWNIDKVEKWFSDLRVEAKQKLNSYGYLRLIQSVPAGRSKVKIALDFMEGEIRGRGEEGLPIDHIFAAESTEAEIVIGGKSIRIRVPAYRDYFLLKLLSARPSDVRDIAAMAWKRGIPGPESLIQRARAASADKLMAQGLKVVIGDISDNRFIDSWRGTFVAQEFSESDKTRILTKLGRLTKALRG
jgi:hypothetical protein